MSESTKDSRREKLGPARVVVYSFESIHPILVCGVIYIFLASPVSRRRRDDLKVSIRASSRSSQKLCGTNTMLPENEISPYSFSERVESRAILLYYVVCVVSPRVNTHGCVSLVALPTKLRLSSTYSVLRCGVKKRSRRGDETAAARRACWWLR